MRQCDSGGVLWVSRLERVGVEEDEASVIVGLIKGTQLTKLVAQRGEDGLSVVV